ncbi:MAG: M23 family metallopeptidase, partial [Anaerolineae bacterium]
GDLYRLGTGDRSWSVERAIDQRRTSPNPVYVGVAISGVQVHILDSSYSQVWLHPVDATADGYLPGGDSPWERAGTDLDLTRGIAIAVDAGTYVLLREGGGAPAAVARFDGTPPRRDAAYAAALDVTDPVAMALGPHDTLALIDEGGRRLRLIDRADGAVATQVALPPDAPPLRAAFSDGERLYVSAAGAVYAFPGTGVTVTASGGQGPASRPDDVQRLAALAALTSPIAGAQFLPLRDSLLPGSTRIYRYGIHRGLDMYDGTMGVAIAYGTAALAAADGVVVRADLDFQEMTPAEFDAIAGQCRLLHYTPDDLLDRLRGRQVWIDHGGGLVTRYVHLSAIAPEVAVGAQVVRGQVIGSVGNSGTSEGAAGTQSGAHLHFEVLIDDQYLGKWLSVPETRRLLERLLYPG